MSVINRNGIAHTSDSKESISPSFLLHYKILKISKPWIFFGGRDKDNVQEQTSRPKNIYRVSLLQKKNTGTVFSHPGYWKVLCLFINRYDFYKYLRFWDYLLTVWCLGSEPKSFDKGNGISCLFSYASQQVIRDLGEREIIIGPPG